MAIYTQLSIDEVTALLWRYGLGPARRLRGVAAGSINTNYFVDTDDARFFLRFSEVATEGELAYEAALLAHLSIRGVPTPTLRRMPDGSAFAALRGKWVSVFDFVAGDEHTAATATAAELERLGAALAHIHAAGADFGLRRPHAFEQDALGRWLGELRVLARPDLADVLPVLHEELAYVSATRPAGLPAGVIHGDLFPDNVKWSERGEVALVFDFEMASDGVLAYDVAVALLAWCWDGAFDWTRARAFVRGYAAARPMGDLERRALYVLARQAALRFTVTRIRDFHLRPMPEGDRVHKDFRDYQRRLAALRVLGPKGFDDAVFGG